ncbi:hypothetical protein [Neobacillus sp. NPDC093127]|uniref:hypothetical protein n=1 Tax=Neobacillus sp. NPDC093127 TaxID=3364296 RepID=UPI003817CE8A
MSQLVQKNWNNNNSIYPNWFITEIFIGEIKTPLMDRREYCECVGIPINTPLWKNEVDGNKNWSKVFKFEPIDIIKCNINLVNMHNEIPTIVHPILYYVFTQQLSLKLEETNYIKILEYVIRQQLKKKGEETY